MILTRFIFKENLRGQDELKQNYDLDRFSPCIASKSSQLLFYLTLHARLNINYLEIQNIGPTAQMFVICTCFATQRSLQSTLAPPSLSQSMSPSLEKVNSRAASLNRLTRSHQVGPIEAFIRLARQQIPKSWNWR